MDTKKLRQKILDLAIRGKLVPQDPNDEPASVLLERIRAEKERLIKEGKIKRSKQSASDTPHYENEVPFEVPENWEWIRLEDYLLLLSGQDLNPQRYNANSIGIPYIIGASNIENERININRWTDKPSVISLLNDILVVCKGAGVGKIAMNDVGKVHIARQIQAVRDETGILDNQYIKMCIDTNISDIISNANGLIPGLKRELLLSLMIPIAPITEQHRIVDVVKRIYSTIDEFDCSVCALQNCISIAKSKILDLAIKGKLVPQDPKDEPAIELLKRINPKFEPCDNAHDTNQLPKSWYWVKLKYICTDFIVPQRDKPIRFDGEIPWCRIEDIQGIFLNGSLSNQKVSVDLIKEMNMRICPIGTVLCSCSASLGIQAITTVPCCTNQTFIGIVPQKELLQEKYLLYYLKSLTKLFHDLGTGTTIKYISRTKFEDLIIPLPPKEEQTHIVSKIEELFTLLDEIKESLEA